MTIRVIEHRNQVVHHLWHEEVVEKLTAPITHIGVVMPKALSYCSKRSKAASQQSAMRTPGVIRDGQLVHQSPKLVAHFAQRVARKESPYPSSLAFHICSRDATTNGDNSTKTSILKPMALDLSTAGT